METHWDMLFVYKKEYWLLQGKIFENLVLTYCKKEERKKNFNFISKILTSELNIKFLVTFKILLLLKS